MCNERRTVKGLTRSSRWNSLAYLCWNLTDFSDRTARHDSTNNVNIFMLINFLPRRACHIEHKQLSLKFLYYFIVWLTSLSLSLSLSLSFSLSPPPSPSSLFLCTPHNFLHRKIYVVRDYGRRWHITWFAIAPNKTFFVYVFNASPS